MIDNNLNSFKDISKHFSYQTTVTIFGWAIQGETIMA